MLKSVQLTITMGFAAMLASCATTPFQQSQSGASIVREALTTPLSVLQSRAERGDARAQLAMGLVRGYGLRGTEVDQATSQSYMDMAIASRGSQPITQYIPGLDGKPGRTAIIMVPKSGIPIGEATAAEGCAAAISAGALPDRGGEKCGGEEVYRSLLSLWRNG